MIPARDQVAAQLLGELIDDETFQAEWLPLQRQALANYEQAPSLAGLITAWLTASTQKRA